LPEVYSAQRSPRAVPLHRVAVLRPFASYLEQHGAPVRREFRRVRLPYAALEDPDNYVPSERFRAFVVSSAQREGIETLGFEVGLAHGANCVDPHMRQRLLRSPTLFHALTKASELTNRTVYNCRMGLAQAPRGGPTYFFHRPSCPDVRNASIDQIGWFGLMVMLGIVRVFTGPHWAPAEIGLMLSRLPGRSIREYFPNTRIRLNQPASYVSLEGLFLGMDAGNGAGEHEFQPHVTRVPRNFQDSVVRLLRSYVSDTRPSVDIAASLCNMSRRSLQRRLAECGTTYSRTLARARFELASSLLADPEQQIIDIASRLGYSDPANFSRAFRRFAGVSPRDYRQALRATSNREQAEDVRH
jgi:AraC-like DNA-binding protein